MNCPFFNKIKIPKNKIKNNLLEIYGDFNPAHPNASPNKIMLPVKSTPYREWYEKHPTTVDHAKHCFPLAMANSLGYVIRSPATFRVSWDGNENSDAKVEIIKNLGTIYNVTTHSAPGSFTIQSRFVFKTSDKHYVYVKGIPNIRTRFNVMEGLLEYWWFQGTFGIVCLLNQPCDFTINEGDPIATILLLNRDSLKFDTKIKNLTDRDLPMYKFWLWWNKIKSRFPSIISHDLEKTSIIKIFQKINKTLILDKNKSWPEWRQYHDFDYARGRHVMEAEKPVDRLHFLPKDLFSEKNIDSIKIDHYNKIK